MGQLTFALLGRGEVKQGRTVMVSTLLKGRKVAQLRCCGPSFMGRQLRDTMDDSHSPYPLRQ